MQNRIIKNLWGKNPHGNDNIFYSIDWKAMESCMKKMAEKSGFKVTNTLKLVHGWQNDGQQKEFFSMRTVRRPFILLDVVRQSPKCISFNVNHHSYRSAILRKGRKLDSYMENSRRQK